jgi:hypothetical protein
MPFLQKWLKAPDRQPLVIRGARQVGKTWIVRQLAALEHRELVEINLEKIPTLGDLFALNDPHMTVEKLRQRLRVVLDPEKSILFIDEIQERPEVFSSLRWFAEEMPELPVIAAGSLLELVLGKTDMSMPVGRVEFMYVEPLSFVEFLHALHYDHLINFLKTFEWGTQIDVLIHQELMKLFKEYIFTGGLPRAVNQWATERSLERINKTHNDLLGAYRADFNKYGTKIAPKVLDEVVKTVVSVLGSKFVYSAVNTSSKTETIKKALELLCDARVCHKIESSYANGLPLGAGINHRFFKVLLLDVGLCSSLLGLSLDELQDVEDVNLVNKGAIAEQVAGQLLRTVDPFYTDPNLFYWLNDARGASAEVDYIIQHKNKVVPVEVKAGKSGTLKSLHYFMGQKKLHQAVRIYSSQPSRVQISLKFSDGLPLEYTLYSIPFYLISEIHRLIE